MQIVVPRFLVQVIPSVSQRVRVGDGKLGGITCSCRCCCQHFAPGAVGIGGYEGARVIGDADDVAHLVGQVEVLGPVVKEPGRVAGVIILEIHGVRPVCLRLDDTIFCCEVGGHSVDRFAGPDAGLVISIAVNVCCAVRVGWIDGDLRKHSSVRPLKLHVAIGQNIAVGVVSQARAVD